ncbi:MAG: aspartate kinase [Acidobacteria bacterium]|jgi:aspartokinase/homoserine dehydrogenase 1|nr:aspartate kinase [Acidobacteriota bacterium]
MAARRRGKGSLRARGRRLEVWKFGGAALADAEAVRNVVALVGAHEGPLVVVVSALSGVTDSLLDGAREALTGETKAAEAAASSFVRRHRDIAHALIPAGPARRRVLATAEQLAREYRETAHAVARLGDLSPRANDILVARGERASSALIAAALTAAGRRAERVDALDIVATDGQYGSAAPDLAATRRSARHRLLPLLKRRTTPVVPGFFGAGPDGTLTTLGRGGTDLTATLLARTLGAARVVLWKDVAGILTADPRSVPDARLLPQMHHREAAEVAYFGAKVLHPRALIPLDGSRIDLQVRSFQKPDQPGTEVSSRRTLEAYPVKALATIRGQSLVTVAGKGLMGVPGMAARTFSAIHDKGLSVSTIFQSSSESSIGFTVPAGEAEQAVDALETAFAMELTAGLVDSVTSRGGLAVIAVVGRGMAGTPGIAARVFSALAAHGINVIAIAQGSSELNISFVVEEDAAAGAARAIHSAFQLAKIGGGRPPDRPRTDVVLLGFGRVGRALADQVTSTDRERVRIVAALDRSGYVFDPRGISRRRLLRLAGGKDRGELLAELGGRPADAATALADIAAHAVSRPALVDVTADETTPLLLAGLEHGFDLVLANKKPLAGSEAHYRRLLDTAEATGRRLLYEATVGAGLPVIDTFRKLLASGDRILRVDGCVSGTLGYVLSALEEGRGFSEVVQDAVEKGYAEPDPRDDLLGRDAGRKGLILARLLGYHGAAPRPDPLVPASFGRLPLRTFFKRLSSLDDEWRRRVEKEAARGRVFRYVVSATPRGVSADLKAVPKDSYVGVLRGTRNRLAFTTRRYKSEPLAVGGPGAGAEVTAAGILNDIQSLAVW